MEVIYIKTSDITPYEKNARKIKDAIPAVANSIKQFGWRVPLIIDANNVLIAGHTRLEAAKQLGIEEVPCVRVEDLTEQQVRAFRLADNKTQELSSWDFSKLMGELEGVSEFDMQSVGFAHLFGDMETKHPQSGKEQDLDEGVELDLDSFSDESFEYICPCCGFRFNEG